MRFTRIQGHAAPGTPAKYNRVGILEVGPRRARNVLVLNPGTSASAAYFQPLAKSIVARAKGWQVWSVERRENLLEDHSMLDRAKAGEATPQQLFDYYLGYLDDPGVTDALPAHPRRRGRLRPRVGDAHGGRGPAARRPARERPRRRRWCSAATRSAARSRRPTRRGTSRASRARRASRASSSSTAAAAATRSPPPTRTRALQELASGSPWLAFGGIGAPFAGLFNSGGSALVRIAPDAPSIAQGFRLLPANLKPPVPATNAGQYGYALDTATSPAAARRGAGAPRPARRERRAEGLGRRRGADAAAPFADVFSGWGLKGLDGTAWYHPLRLTIDAGAVAAGNDNPAQRTLGLRAVHGDDLPEALRIYAFAASLGGTRVLDAARTLAAQSRHPARAG